MQFLQEHWGAIVAALLALSEVLALIPGIKSKGVFQLVVNLLKAAAPKKQDQLPKK